MVAQVSERDPGVLAGMIHERTAAFLSTARPRSGGDSIVVSRATVSTLVGLLALDHHLHGGQFAETAGSVWTGQVADLHAPLSTVLPYAFDPDAAKGFHGSFTLRLRGVDPLRYAIDHGRLTMDLAGRTDCTLTADPQTFLRVGIGVVSQLRAALTGKMRAGGRKPWLGFFDQPFVPADPARRRRPLTRLADRVTSAMGADQPGACDDPADQPAFSVAVPYQDGPRGV
jgi:putative sterol carrier protein